MSDINFQPEKRTIEELLVGADYYVIPRFQRPYSWDASNLDDFWRDVVFDNKPGYFIGPMVAWRDTESPICRLVDGQQRITTIVIIFSAIRDELARLGEIKLADGVHRYLEKPDRNNELQFTLRAEIASPFLSRAILRNPPDAGVEPASEEEVALSKTLDAVRKRVSDEVNQRTSPQEFLLELRDRLLSLQVIWVENSNEDDAYVIFETLNSRGKDLEIVDLLKNLLLNKLRESGNSAADTARATWEQMRNELEAGEQRRRIDPNRYILHWWLSQEAYVAERKLFPAIRDEIKSKSAARTRLASLKRDAVFYRAVLEPDSRSWPIEERDAQKALEALQIFGIVQPAPLLLSLLRARESSPKLKASQFRDTLRVIERFHFLHTVVTQLRSSGGVSEMYAKAGRELNTAGADQGARAEALNEIRQKLVDRKPEREQFLAAFEDRFFFTNEYTRDSKLVRYVLRRMLEALNPQTSLVDLTVEHIMPQRAMSGGESFETVGSIGNLILVDTAMNSLLDDKSFDDKRTILANAGSVYDIGGVLSESVWTSSEVAARTRLLAERAYDEVWKLPL